MPGSDAIDDQEIATLIERQQRVVPAAAVVLDALSAVGEEGPRPLLGAGGDDDEETGAGQRDEGLAARGVALDLGAPVFFRHAKAGELMERFSEVLLVSGDRVVERAPTYRGAGQCYF